MGRRVSIFLLCAVAVLSISGCATLPTFETLNLNRPGWELRQGQAVWKSDREAPEIVGDVLAAWNQNGQAVVQFSKTFPLIEARLEPHGWQLDAGAGNRRYSARGEPPRRVIWFQLLRVLSGRDIERPYRFEGGVLRNEKTGEWLEVHLE